MCVYFADRLAWLVPIMGRKHVVVALWGTALRTRETWARVRPGVRLCLRLHAASGWPVAMLT